MSEISSDVKTYGKNFIWKQRIGLGLSMYGGTLGDFMVNTYLMIFLTDTVKLPVVAVGFMFMITRVIDAFTDYIVGALVDRTRTKLGRSRPWMLVGAPIVAISLIATFTTPNFSPTGKLIWAYITYLAFSCSGSIIAVPRGALLASLSNETVERTNLATAKMVCSTLANFTCASMALFLIHQLGNGNEATGYFRTVIIFAILLISMMYIAIFNINEINLPSMTQKRKRSNIFKDLADIFSDKQYTLFLIISFFMWIGITSTSTALAYYFKYIIGNMNLLSLALSIFSLVPVVAILLSPAINKKMTKRDIALYGAIIQGIGFILLFFSKINLTFVYISIAIIAFGLGFRQTMSWSMQPDLFDHIEWKSGKSMAGVPTAIVSYMGKIGNSFASLFIGLLLAWGNYNGSLSVQSESAKTAIIAVTIGIPLISIVICAILLKFYNVDKILPQIKPEIDARRAAAEIAADSE